MKRIGTTTVLENEWESWGFNPLDLPRRAVLLEAISKYEFNSVLDVGCDKGQDLILIKNLNPKIITFGVEHNGDSIKEAKIDNIIHRADLNCFPDESFDLVISNCAVNYSPELVEQMIRVAKKAVVMLEPARTHLEAVMPKNVIRTKATSLNSLWDNSAYIYEIVK